MEQKFVEAAGLIIDWVNHDREEFSWPPSPRFSNHKSDVTIPLGDYVMTGVHPCYDGVQKWRPDARIDTFIAQVFMLNNNLMDSTGNRYQTYGSIARVIKDMVKVHALRRITSKEKHKLFEAFTDYAFYALEDKYLGSLVVTRTFGGYNSGLRNRPTPDKLLGTIGTTLTILGAGFDYIAEAAGDSPRAWRSAEGQAEAIKLMADCGVHTQKLTMVRMALLMHEAVKARNLHGRAMECEKMLRKVAVVLGENLCKENFRYHPLAGSKHNPNYGNRMLRSGGAVWLKSQEKEEPHSYAHDLYVATRLQCVLTLQGYAGDACTAYNELASLPPEKFALFVEETNKSLARKLVSRGYR